MKNRWYITLVLLLAAACSPVPSVPDPAQTSVTSEPDLSEIPPFAPNPGDNSNMEPFATLPPSTDLDTMVQNAIQDIAQKFSTTADQITVVEAREVVWSNSSLGCPQDGMAYAEVLTLGYLVKLLYNNIEIEYHSGMDGALFRCKNPIPPVDGTPINT